MDEKNLKCCPIRIGQVVRRHRDQKWPLIPILQEIQNEFGYIPPEAIEPISKALNMFPSLEYTLDTVACIGVCAMAPNMVIGKQTHGHLNPKKVSQLLGGSNNTRG